MMRVNRDCPTVPCEVCIVDETMRQVVKSSQTSRSDAVLAPDRSWPYGFIRSSVLISLQSHIQPVANQRFPTERFSCDLARSTVGVVDKKIVDALRQSSPPAPWGKLG